MSITQRIMFALVVTSFVAGFFLGVSRIGHHEANKAQVADAQADVLKDKIAKETQDLRDNYEARLASLQDIADQSDQKVADLQDKLAKLPKNKPVAVPASTGDQVHTDPVIAPDPASTIEHQLVAAQATEIIDLKAVNQAQKGEILGLKKINTDLQQELNLKEIALKAQISSNSSTGWKWGFKGLVVGVGADEVVSLLTGRRK